MSLQDKTHSKLTEFAAETMVYFERHKLIEIAKKVLVECALERPHDVEKWIGKNIKRIANEIYLDCLNEGKDGIVKSLYLSGNFLYRIVMFGRRGSGRKTQAINLVSRFNLVFIDVEILIHQHLRGDDFQPYDALDRELQRAFFYNNCAAKSNALLDIIARLLLENNCLTQGWVLVNFPNTLKDFKYLLENFKIPPNKVVYLKCPEKTCMRRLLAMPDLGKPCQSCTYYEHEMRFFNQQEQEISNYLLKRHETVYVDAKASSEDVKTAMMSSIVRSPYVMGFKQDTRD